MSHTAEKDARTPWEVRQFARVRDEARFWRERFQKANVELATMKAEKALEEFRDRTDVAWLQGKVVRQQRELKRLNDALNTLRIEHGYVPVDDVSVESVTLVEVRSQQHGGRVIPPGVSA